MSSYKNILLAIDVYEPYHDLLLSAQHFVNAQQAKFHCVYAMPSMASSIPSAYDFQQSVENEASRLLSAVRETYGCETVLLKGLASVQICDYAKAMGADLIICGSHGKHGLELLLGSTANGILHNAHCDVLTIRLNKENQCVMGSSYKHIVLASDLNPNSKKVALKANSVAQIYQAKLHIIHAITYISATASAYYPEIENDLKAEAEQNLSALSQELNVDLSDTQIAISTPKQAILQAAKKFQAELIVVGTQGKSAITSALLGSTANAVLHYAPCNVLVVRI